MMKHQEIRALIWFWRQDTLIRHIRVIKHMENQLVTICNQLELQSADDKYYKTDCVNTRFGKVIKNG